MPYFKWYGVDLLAETQQGKSFALSREQLDIQLFEQEIALLECKPIAMGWSMRPVRLAQVVDFFRQLSVLVGAGVYLPEALAIVAQQCEHPRMQAVVHTLAYQVHSGIAFSTALQAYPRHFNSIVIQLIYAGEESGTLPTGLDALCHHLEATHDFYTRLRSALVLPLVTLGFFGAIAALIFTVIIPRFVSMFSSMGKDVPAITRALMSISEFMRSWSMVMVVAGSVFFVWALVMWRKTKRGGRVVDRILINVPLFGPLVQQRFCAYLFRALGMLVGAGVPVVHALHLIKATIVNAVFFRWIAQLEDDVRSGYSLRESLRKQNNVCFTPNVIAMIHVGQESGRLPFILEKIAAVYRAHVMRKIQLITVMVQPLLMIVLGLLAALLIFAVYGPIMTLSHVA